MHNLLAGPVSLERLSHQRVKGFLRAAWNTIYVSHCYAEGFIHLYLLRHTVAYGAIRQSCQRANGPEANAL